ncbi:hypothetical protein LPJ75_005751, partial [Coemansia sp. RSA 2598]
VLDDEDEVFFGPLTMTELSGMRKRADSQRRSTQVMTLTPLVEEEAPETLSQKVSLGNGSQAAPTLQSSVYAAVRIQALSRGYLSRREYGKRMGDMRVLELRGSACVQRRRTLRGRAEQKTGEPSGIGSQERDSRAQTLQMDPGDQPQPAPQMAQAQAQAQPCETEQLESPPRRGRSFRTWFQRQPAPPRAANADAASSPHKGALKPSFGTLRAPLDPSAQAQAQAPAGKASKRYMATTREVRFWAALAAEARLKQWHPL